MANLTNNCRHILRQWSPVVQCVRHKTKLKMGMFRATHRERSLVEHLAKPIYPERADQKKQPKKFVVEEPEPFFKDALEKIFAQEAKEKLMGAQMIAVFHRNTMDKYAYNAAKQLIWENDMTLLHYSAKFISMALTGTKYEPILQLYHHMECTVISQNTDVKTLLKVERKLPSLALMAIIIEDRIFSRTQLQEISELPDLDGMRSQLVSTLASSASRLSHNLGHHSSTLSTNLTQYVKDRTEGGTPSPPGES